MKKTFKTVASLALILICLFGFASCKEKKTATGLWANAIYTEDTELGNGSKTRVRI